jgi:hypothetical protein
VTRAPDVQYFVEKCIRRGLATYAEVREVGERYGIDYVDSLVQELSAAGTQLIAEEDVMISPQTNVLMNDLRLVELVSLAVQLPVAPKVRRRLHKDVIQQRSYELDLKRLDYLDNDYEWYYFSPPFNRLQRAIRRLFDSGRIPFATEWRNHKDNHAYIKGLMEHPLFAERILHKIREHYLGLREVKLLVHWIEATEEPAPVMVDIIQAGLSEDGPELVRGILFSNEASTAGGVLRRRHDVCFSCPREKRCLPVQNVYDPYHVLMEYRYSDLNRLLAKRYPGEAWADCLIRDWMVAKFFIPYTVTVTAKRWMVAIDLLNKASVVLDKSHGKYCPKDDRWVLEASAFPEETNKSWRR